MSSLGTDIIAALWKGPKVAMLVIVESTLSQSPRNANHCSSSTRRTGAIPKDALGNQYDFFRWRVYWGSEQFRPTPTTCRSFPDLP